MPPYAEAANEAEVSPGTPSFRCIPDECQAQCCRNPYRVDLGEEEAARLASQVDAAEVLEEWAAMILLRQENDRCKLLSDDNRCKAYEARPTACRDYPFRLSQEGEGPPRVVRDLACPGFIGPPMSRSEYEALVQSLSGA